MGTDAKSMERPEKSWSIRLLYQLTERIPMGTPTRMMSSMEKTAIRTLVSARVEDDVEHRLVEKYGCAEISLHHSREPAAVLHV